MTLKKRLLAVLAVLCVATLMIYVGMSGKEILELESVDQDKTLRDKETIYFWYSEEELTDYINSAAVAFGERENIRVIPNLVSDGEYLEAIYDASLKEEKIPDVYLLENSFLEKAYLSGLATEISDEKKIVNQEHFPETALLASTYKEKIVAYPYLYETTAFIYNKTFMDDWAKQQLEKKDSDIVLDDTVSGGEVIVDNSADGPELTTEQQIAVMVQGGIPSTMDEVLGFADSYDASETVEAVFKWDVSDIFYNYQFAGASLNVGGQTGDQKDQITILNDETIQCLEMYKNLNQFFYIESDKVTSESVLEEFIEGKLVFTIGTTEVIEKLEKARKDGIFPYEYGISLLPDPSSTVQGKGLSVTTVAVVNGYSNHKDKANQFATFLTGEYLDKLYERTGRVSASYDTNKGNELLKVFMKAYEDSASLPKLIETSNYWIQLEIMFSKIWNGADVREQLTQLSEQVQSQLNSVSH